MSIFRILPYYIAWHYTRALRDMAHIWKNFFHSTYHFFSIGLLTRNLFSPWQRMDENYGQSSFFETLIVNTLMRGVGFCIRLIVITMGFCALIFLTILGIAIYIVWLLWPVFVVLLCGWLIRTFVP
jgi:hypothetical protein